MSYHNSGSSNQSDSQGPSRSYNYDININSNSLSNSFVPSSVDSQYIYFNANFEMRDQYEENQDQYYDQETHSDHEISHYSYEHSSDYNQSSQQFQPSNEINSINPHHIYPYMQQHPPKAGLSRQQIQKIAQMRWSKHNHKMNKQQTCTICLIKYEINDNLRVLNCLHRYHKQCVDIWLNKNQTCPNCRNVVQVQNQAQAQSQ